MPHPTLREPDPLLPLHLFKTCLASNGSGVFRPRRNSPFRPPPRPRKGEGEKKFGVINAKEIKKGRGEMEVKKEGKRGILCYYKK